MAGETSNRYGPELKERAVRMFEEIREEQESEWADAAGCRTGGDHLDRDGPQVGAPGAGRRRRAGRDDSEEPVEVKRLRREVAELNRANAILKAASTFIAAELNRPRG